MKRGGVGARRAKDVGGEGDSDSSELAEAQGAQLIQPEQQKLRAARLRYCRKLVSHKVAEAMPLIVDKFADEAKKGSIEHAQALLKLSGTEPGKPAATDKPKRSKGFAAELLKEIRSRAPLA